MTAAPIVYEIVVDSLVGPVLRAALAPATTMALGVHTLVRVTRPETEDVEDVVRILGSCGFDVEHVLLLSTRDPGASQGSSSKAVSDHPRRARSAQQGPE